MATRTASASKCKVCRQPAVMTIGLHRVCSYDCGAILAKQLQAKQANRKAAEDRKAHRLRKASARPRAKRLAAAQAAFNRYIRARDTGKPCVSCGHPDDGTRQRQAGHYKPAGSNPSLRFDEANTHSQCARCNNHLSGNLVPYREELARRIGQAELDRLEGPQTPAHYTDDDLETIRTTYAAKARSDANR